MLRRVAVTGIGAISPFGLTFADFWNGVSNGTSAIRPITSIEPGKLRFTNGAEIPEFVPSAHFDEKEAGYLDRFAQVAVVAAREAVQAAGIAWNRQLRETCAVVMGASGGKISEDEGFQGLYVRGDPRVSPLTIPRVMPNAAASRISLEFGITGPVYTISTACSSSNHAIGQAFWMIREGKANRALAGGSEAPFSLGFLKAWEAMRVVAPDTCRPFSLGRQGLILGEGASVLLLESWEEAEARGASILGEIVGFGMSSDAHHITQPSADGAARAIRAALADANLAPESIDYVNAHGTGTMANDATETMALKSVFAGHVNRLIVSSTKSMHGHALAAAGALEAAATIAALRHSLVPPTANFTAPDPACDLDIVPNQPRHREISFALSNSFAFGGLNAVLIFSRPPA